MAHLGKQDEAKPWLEKLLVDADGEPHTLLFEVTDITNRKDTAALNDFVDKYLKDKPDLMTVWPMVMLYYIHNLEFDRALQVIEGTWDEICCFRFYFPYWYIYRINKGLYLMSQEQWQKAADLLDVDMEYPGCIKGCKLTAFFPRTHYNRGRCFEMMGDMEAAKHEWNRCLEIKIDGDIYPSSRIKYWMRKYFHALSLDKLGRKEEAETYICGIHATALSLRNMDANRKQLLGLVYKARHGSDDQKDTMDSAQLEVKKEMEL